MTGQRRVNVPEDLFHRILTYPQAVQREFFRLVLDLGENPNDNDPYRTSVDTPEGPVFAILGNGAFVTYTVKDGQVLVDRAEPFAFGTEPK